MDKLILLASIIEGDLPNQVAVSTGSTVLTLLITYPVARSVKYMVAMNSSASSTSAIVDSTSRTME